MDYYHYGRQDSWITWNPTGMWIFHPENLENLEFAWKGKKKAALKMKFLEWIFILLKLWRNYLTLKLQSIDERLPFWRACLKSTWNFTVYIKFNPWKLCIFDLENLEYSFEKSDYPNHTCNCTQTDYINKNMLTKRIMF